MVFYFVLKPNEILTKPANVSIDVNFFRDFGMYRIVGLRDEIYPANQTRIILNKMIYLYIPCSFLPCSLLKIFAITVIAKVILFAKKFN